MISVMLMFHWAVTAIVCAASLDSPVWVGILSFVVVFSFWTINYIATELEMPFGDDLNDLPLHEMQCDLNLSLRALMDDHANRTPQFAYREDEHKKLSTKTSEFH